MTEFDMDDKIEWDEAFEKQCGYLPECSPLAARRASVAALQGAMNSMHAGILGHSTQQAHMQAMMQGASVYDSLLSGQLGGAPSSGNLFGALGGAVGGLFG